MTKGRVDVDDEQQVLGGQGTIQYYWDGEGIRARGQV